MAKKQDPNAVVHWIFYWNDGKTGRQIEFAALGSRRAEKIEGNVLKGGGFNGTYNEARALAVKLNKQYAVRLSNNYTGASFRKGKTR